MTACLIRTAGEACQGTCLLHAARPLYQRQQLLNKLLLLQYQLLQRLLLLQLLCMLLLIPSSASCISGILLRRQTVAVDPAATYALQQAAPRLLLARQYCQLTFKLGHRTRQLLLLLLQWLLHSLQCCLLHDVLSCSCSRVGLAAAQSAHRLAGQVVAGRLLPRATARHTGLAVLM